MSDIDELKARAEKLGLIVSYRSDGDAYIKHSRYDFHLRWHTAKAAIIMAESSARIAAERVKASARVCKGCTMDASIAMSMLPEVQMQKCKVLAVNKDCKQCHGTGVRFEEEK